MKQQPFKYDKEQFVHFGILTVVVLLICLSQPFLRYPYDMYYHLITIDQLQDSIHIPNGRLIWHYIWAKIFNLLSILPNEIFLRAKIIHVVQTLISFFTLFYFSKVAIRNIFKTIDKNRLFYLSLWSTLTWFVIFATFSVKYHMVWILWYSVNYQITLPLFWYILALSLQLFWEHPSHKKKFFYVIQIIILSRFILQAHSMEYMYYLMHLFVFMFFYIKEIIVFFKRYFYIVIPSIIAIVYMIKKYQPDHSKFFNYLSLDKLPKLIALIKFDGSHLVGGFNRAGAMFNELMVTILVMIVVCGIFLFFQRDKCSKILELKKSFYFVATAMFIFIPLNIYSAGIFSVITHVFVVNRLFYSSSIFLFLPVMVYAFLTLKNKASIQYINITILGILLSVLIFSKYDYRHNFYNNVKSIYSSVFTTKYNFHLNDQQIKEIGDIIQKIESKQYQKPILYYARADIIFVIKYIYRKPVFSYNRRANPDYIQKHEEAKQQKGLTFIPILIEIPKGFPPLNMYH